MAWALHVAYCMVLDNKACLSLAGRLQGSERVVQVQDDGFEGSGRLQNPSAK